jgi:hypothetical protein
MLRCRPRSSVGPNAKSVTATLLLFCRLHRAAQNRVPIALDAIHGEVVASNITKCFTKIRTSAYPGGDAGREILTRCHHDRSY